jgi:hypothetical protein
MSWGIVDIYVKGHAVSRFNFSIVAGVNYSECIIVVAN